MTRRSFRLRNDGTLKTTRFVHISGDALVALAASLASCVTCDVIVVSSTDAGFTRGPRFAISIHRTLRRDGQRNQMFWVRVAIIIGQIFFYFDSLTPLKGAIINSFVIYPSITMCIDIFTFAKIAVYLWATILLKYCWNRHVGQFALVFHSDYVNRCVQCFTTLDLCRSQNKRFRFDRLRRARDDFASSLNSKA